MATAPMATRTTLADGLTLTSRMPCSYGSRAPPRLPRAVTRLAALPVALRNVPVVIAKVLGKIGPKKKPVSSTATMVTEALPVEAISTTVAASAPDRVANKMVLDEKRAPAAAATTIWHRPNRAAGQRQPKTGRGQRAD
jgi:hypothetical protein